MKRRGSRAFAGFVCYLIACRASFQLMAATTNKWTVCFFAAVELLVPIVAFLWLVNRRIWRDLHDTKSKTLY
ncbi:hypothetical protein BSF38_03082 [Paludisphaera borealis]|uniref:Uncharacterized protein n=1 Tax=Paludisphaera borealis TaxID=1387353 RepID=A0A1U7CRJ2_9BACT|nr:hypothetical protein BSF38_03082 [Paludisphaera borealis]